MAIELLKYELLEDYRSAKAALEYINDFIEHKGLDVKTFGDQNLIWAKERLQKRIDNYEKYYK